MLFRSDAGMGFWNENELLHWE